MFINPRLPFCQNVLMNFLITSEQTSHQKILSTYEFVLKRFREYFGKVAIDAIGTREMDFYKIDRSKKVSPSGTNIELRGIKAFFKLLETMGNYQQKPVRWHQVCSIAATATRLPDRSRLEKAHRQPRR
jgi:hypothetical protein